MPSPRDGLTARCAERRLTATQLESLACSPGFKWDAWGNLKARFRVGATSAVGKGILDGRYRAVSFGQAAPVLVDNRVCFGVRKILVEELSVVEKPGVEAAYMDCCWVLGAPGTQSVGNASVCATGADVATRPGTRPASEPVGKKIMFNPRTRDRNDKLYQYGDGLHTKKVRIGATGADTKYDRQEKLLDALAPRTFVAGKPFCGRIVASEMSAEAPPPPAGDVPPPPPPTDTPPPASTSPAAGGNNSAACYSADAASPSHTEARPSGFATRCAPAVPASVRRR